MHWELIALGMILFLFLTFVYVENRDVKYATIYIGDEQLKTEVADTLLKKTKGLMFRDEIGSDSMLFVNSEPSRSGIWMSNMRFPIDIIWVNDGKVIDIKENAQPCKMDCEVYYPIAPAKYVIEVPAGWSKDNKINVGVKVKIPENI